MSGAFLEACIKPFDTASIRTLSRSIGNLKKEIKPSKKLNKSKILDSLDHLKDSVFSYLIEKN